MKNFYEGGRGLCQHVQHVETLHATSLQPNPRNQDVPQNMVCASRRETVRRGKKCFAQLMRANHYSPLPLLLIFICFLFHSVAQAQSVGERAVAGGNEIRPLQIGDTIPEELWNLPLQVVNHPDGKNSITLNDYRGSIILLDFMSTGCSGCIEAIPRLNNLQNQYLNNLIILPVTSENPDHVSAFTAKNEHLKNLTSPVVVSDKILKKIFPHLYISHVIWIDTLGLVKAATRTNHITKRALNELHSDKVWEWPQKTENTTFFSKPLIALLPEADSLPNNRKRKLCYATLTSYTEGVGAYRAVKEDSLMGVERISYRNRSVLDLYLIGFKKLHRLPPAQIILEVADISAIDISKADLDSISHDQWYQKNALCYERTMPLGTPKEVWLAAMVSDLNIHLGLFGRIEVRNGKECFVLSEI